MKKATLLKWEHKIWTQLKVSNLKVPKNKLCPFFQIKPISNNRYYVAADNMYIHNTHRDTEPHVHNLHRNIYMQPLHCLLRALISRSLLTSIVLLSSVCLILYGSFQGNSVTALKVQKKLFKVCYNVVKMKIKRRHENACRSMEAYSFLEI